MEHTRHIIHRQSLEVAFERPAQQFGLQDRLAAVYHQRILPQLSNVFGEFERESPGVLTIPVLSIDCGMLRGTYWEDELTATVANRIRDELQRYRNSPEAGKPMTRQWNAEFIHFLQTGRFQWDSRKEIPADYESRLILDKSFLDELTAALGDTGDVLKRLFHYCTSDFIIRLADALSEHHIPQGGLAYVKLLEKAGVEAAVRSMSVINAYSIACCRPSAGVESFVIALTESIWPMTSAALRAKIVERIAQSVKTAEDAERFPFLKTDFIAYLLPLISGEFPGWAAVVRQQGNGELSEAQRLQVGKKDPADDRMLLTRQKLEAYYVTNAGLVLAYPFIASLLQRMALMDNERQFFPETKGKATVLLQHLVYESPLTEENELPLNKLLSGLQPTSFVDPLLFEYTPETQRECEDVLHAIVTHWSVLRNTSVAGLRETFLQREGKLTLRTDGWLLQVDSRGVDVLLASLPWSIGIIKLPWMDGMLYVEWA